MSVHTLCVCVGTTEGAQYKLLKLPYHTHSVGGGETLAPAEHQAGKHFIHRTQFILKRGSLLLLQQAAIISSSCVTHPILARNYYAAKYLIHHPHPYPSKQDTVHAHWRCMYLVYYIYVCGFISTIKWQLNIFIY